VIPMPSTYSRSVRWALFEEVDDQHVQVLLGAARRRRFAKGETVFHEGDAGESLHLIDKGYVAVRVTTPAGDVATLRVLRAGQHFGDLAVLSADRRSATVTALEKTETLEVPSAVIRDFSSEHRSFERAMTRVIAQQLRSQSNQLLEAMYLPVPRRLARRLIELCDLYAGEAIPLTQDDLAGISGTTRQTVNQLLTEWRDAGTVELGRGRVIVADRARLERSAR
jgi:CRP/FNR family transcriptional regulator, cyclic AMP receptor protein